MADAHKDSPPEVASARIEAIYKAARKLSIETGGDPAEAMFELVAAAILIAHEARPTIKPAQMIADIAPAASATVDAWFSTYLKQIRTRQA